MAWELEKGAISQRLLRAKSDITRYDGAQIPAGGEVSLRQDRNGTWHATYKFGITKQEINAILDERDKQIADK